MMPRAQRFVTGLPESPLPGVSPAQWERFVKALEVQPVDAVSDSGGLGCYDMRSRRLVELGYASNLRSVRAPSGRQISVCDFALPWTLRRFLTDPVAQYAALVKSMKDYHQALTSGELNKSQDASLSGTMAVLHLGGRGALRAWPNLFENTRRLYDATREVF